MFVFKFIFVVIYFDLLWLLFCCYWWKSWYNEMKMDCLPGCPSILGDLEGVWDQPWQWGHCQRDAQDQEKCPGYLQHSGMAHISTRRHHFHVSFIGQLNWLFPLVIGVYDWSLIMSNQVQLERTWSKLKIQLYPRYVIYNLVMKCMLVIKWISSLLFSGQLVRVSSLAQYVRALNAVGISSRLHVLLRMN